MTQYILAIDQGTSSSRAVIYDRNLSVVASGQHSFKQHYPRPGWVEHDLSEIWTSVRDSVRDALAALPDGASHRISAIAITNQRETFGLWDRTTGMPESRAIVWQCRRSEDICNKLKKTKAGRALVKETGLVLDPYFSGTKLKHLLAQSPELSRKAKSGALLFGTIDTFLLWKLTGGRSHKTDVTNASRTLMMSLKSQKWSDKALKTLGVPRAVLPEIVSSDADFGSTSGLDFLPEGIPIRGILGDQQAALFGQGCFGLGDAKITYGTGAFFLINTGSKIRTTQSGVSTLAWKIGREATFAIEGSVFIAGAAVQFLRDNLGLIRQSSEMESLARSVPDNGGVFFIPALTGLGAPHWFSPAKGLLGGLSRGSTKAHIARATLEGINHSIVDLLETLVKDSKKPLKKLRVDGGATANNLLLEVQAGLLNRTIERASDLESTARGAASMAAIALGWKSVKEIEKLNPAERLFKPKMATSIRAHERKTWRRRVRGLIGGAY